MNLVFFVLFLHFSLGFLCFGVLFCFIFNLFLFFLFHLVSFFMPYFLAFVGVSCLTRFLFNSAIAF